MTQHHRYRSRTSDTETAALLESLIRQGAAHGYPDGMTQDELSAKFDVVDGQVAEAQLTLAAIQLLTDGATDIWVRDDGEVVYFLRRDEPPKPPPGLQ